MKKKVKVKKKGSFDPLACAKTVESSGGHKEATTTLHARKHKKKNWVNLHLYYCHVRAVILCQLTNLNHMWGRGSTSIAKCFSLTKSVTLWSHFIFSIEINNSNPQSRCLAHNHLMSEFVVWSKAKDKSFSITQLVIRWHHYQYYLKTPLSGVEQQLFILLIVYFTITKRRRSSRLHQVSVT